MHTRPPHLSPSRTRWRLFAGFLLALTVSLSAHAFDFNDVAKRAQALAKKPYKPSAEKLPAALQTLGPQKYRSIRMRPDDVLWHSAKNAFEVELLPPGDVFTTPIRINEITNQGVREIRFDSALFDYGDTGIGPRTLAGVKLAFSGLRIRYAANGKTMEDVLRVQGASYMRGQLKGQQGALARGLAVDTALNSGEKFPQFVELWLERPANGDKELGLYALLDSPDVTGAYRFVLRPGTETVVDVKAQLYLRKAPQKLGIAPLTGMFYFGENQPRTVEDYRPEVHNVDGLSIHGGDGEWIWRPLSNPKRLLVTSFAQSSPDGFGLVQRDRSFSDYEDTNTRYDLQPSVWVEPKGKWGDGRIELVQIPSPSEWNDNIVAYWVPDALPSAGKPLLYEYRLSWFRDGHRPANAWATQTRWGYRNKPDNSATLIVDFEGPGLKSYDAGNPLESVASCDANGKVLSNHTYYNEATGGWRMELQVQRNDPTQLVETRAFLRKDNATLSETWSYILPPAN